MNSQTAKSIDPKLRRINLDGVICEYILNGDRCVIFLEGLPTIPKKDKILSKFSEEGYSVFYPRYRGTWESDGEFLNESPTVEIDQLIIDLSQGIEIEGELHSFSEINIISSSFGAYVALNLNLHYVNKLICLSPVTDFQKVIRIENLENFIREKYLMGYRFTSENWSRLLNNEFSNFINLKENSGKITIFAGGNDNQIRYEDICLFANEYSIHIVHYPELGHLSFSIFEDEEILSKALDYLCDETY